MNIWLLHIEPKRMTFSKGSIKKPERKGRKYFSPMKWLFTFLRALYPTLGHELNIHVEVFCSDVFDFLPREMRSERDLFFFHRQTVNSWNGRKIEQQIFSFKYIIYIIKYIKIEFLTLSLLKYTPIHAKNLLSGMTTTFLRVISNVWCLWYIIALWLSPHHDSDYLITTVHRNTRVQKIFT